MEIMYQVSVDGIPVRFGFGYQTASAKTAWKSYHIWADNPHAEVAIDEFHDGQYSHTLRNSEAERQETVPDVTSHHERMESRPGRNAGVLRNGVYSVTLMEK